MAARANMFLSSIKDAFKGNIEWKQASTKIKVTLLNDNFGAVVDQNNLTHVSDLDLFNCLSTATNNADQTLDLTSDGISQVNSILGDGNGGGGAAGGIVKFNAPDIIFPNLTSGPSGATSIRFAVIYHDTGVNSTSPLIGYVNFGSNIELTEQNLKIVWHADGVFKVTFAIPLL